MRYVLAFGSALLLLACEHEEEMRPVMPAPFEATETDAQRDTHESAPMTYQEAPPSAPPRLSHVVTLGQQDDYAPLPVAPPPGQSSGVVVNNNITVTSPPAYGYGGYYGGYGYGYGYSRGFGHRGTTDGRAGVAVPPSRGPWAPSGWEGAQRTAAPGQTPGVGGNYAPPPSYGPQQMK